MNRFKFRVWCKISKIFSTQPCIVASGRQLLWLHTSNQVTITNLDNDDYIIQQWTGLEDKNGKEIYEGDIIQLDGAPYRYEILWDTWKWGILPLDFESDIQGLTSPVYDRAFVIGNIFENAELLK